MTHCLCHITQFFRMPSKEVGCREKKICGVRPVSGGIASKHVAASLASGSKALTNYS